ncbi:MAG TPA: DJ-1/PfpI family protein [Aldersonia sp.]
MSRKVFRRIGLGLVVVLAAAAAAGGVWLATLPGAPTGPNPEPVPQAEVDATLAALAPPKRERPLVAVVGINDTTEVTDYLVPYGILHHADVADVVALATEPGPVTLYPALRVEPQQTVADFDAAHPDGADYVVVPRMSRDDDPVVLDWLRAQHAKGAIVIGVCAGAKVVAASGLLDGRRATTHWYFVDELRELEPNVEYVPDRRFVVDRGVATTTGITASMPAMLTLIEAIAGRERAAAVAAELGVTSWDARHDSAAFVFNRPFALTIVRNTTAFWNDDRLGIELTDGIDEVSLALVADAWSRTYRSQAVSFADGPVVSRGGLQVLPEEQSAPGDLLSIDDRPPAQRLASTLDEIAGAYGDATADVVVTELEYPRG